MGGEQPPAVVALCPPSPELSGCCCSRQVAGVTLSTASQPLEKCPPAKAVLERSHCSWGASGSCCTPELSSRGGDMSEAGRRRFWVCLMPGRGAVVVAESGFVPAPWSCQELLLHWVKSSRGPCLCQSLFHLEGLGGSEGMEGNQELLGSAGVYQSSGEPWPHYQTLRVCPCQGLVTYWCLLVAEEKSLKLNHC